MRSWIFVAVIGVVGCAHETPQGETPSGGASASASVAPTSDGVAGGGAGSPARTLPKLDQTCAADADCVVLTDEIVDHPPSNFACCAGCTQRAGNRTWYSQFHAACVASPAPQCPAIGCALPVVTAACVAHKCEIKTK